MGSLLLGALGLAWLAFLGSSFPRPFVDSGVAYRLVASVVDGRYIDNLDQINIDGINVRPVGDVLTASEAAARLGVKVETLYAYVSRGVVHRVVADDGRSSLFDRREVESVRSRSGRRPVGGVSAVVTSAVTRVADDGLWYRGTPVVDLVRSGVAFEEVAELLWASGGLDRSSWHVDENRLAVVRAVQDTLPRSAPTIDRLRVIVATVSATDELRADLSGEAVRSLGRTLLSALVDGLPGGRARNGRLAERLWPRLSRQRAQPAHRDALNTAMVLVADHDLAVSTYAAWVAASTRADPYAVVQAGLGALGGPLHGAASRECSDLFSRADLLGSGAAAIGEVLARGRRVPGFGHKVYIGGDPRYGALVEACRAAYPGDGRWRFVGEIERLGSERSGGRLPNIDLAFGFLTVLGGMAPSSGETIFAIARTAGWLAHALEEYDEPALRFRPQSRHRPVPQRR